MAKITIMGTGGFGVALAVMSHRFGHSHLVGKVSRGKLIKYAAGGSIKNCCLGWLSTAVSI